jgi:hypothetical protein
VADPRHPTAQVTELYDPFLVTPPSGDLLCINPGGVLIVGPWRVGYLAWGYKPRIPETVKNRIRESSSRLLAGKEIKGTPYV